MAALTPKQEMFAQAVARGVPVSQAYEAAGYKASRSNAAWLAHEQHIAERIATIQADVRAREDEARQAAVAATALTKEWVIDSLRLNAEMALGQAQTPDGKTRLDPSAANRSLELLGRELGMFAERRVIDQRVHLVDERAAEADRFLAESMERLAAIQAAQAAERDRDEAVH